MDWINIIMLGTYPKSVMNTAWCEIGGIIDGPAPDITDIIRVIEVDVVYVYTAAAPGGNVHKMHIGMGFGPGFRH